jgi:hypothetical protein
LNDKMDAVASYSSVEKDTRPMEQLSLVLDRNFAASGSQVAVRGTGFAINETLTIQFNKVKIAEVQTDDYGRFQTVITVPTIKGPLSTDVKVTGQNSKLTYSTSFRVE